MENKIKPNIYSTDTAPFPFGPFGKTITSVVNFTPKIMFGHWGFENGSIFALSFHLLPIFQWGLCVEEHFKRGLTRCETKTSTILKNNEESIIQFYSTNFTNFYFAFVLIVFMYNVTTKKINYLSRFISTKLLS